jgi:hypothetical protein
MNGLKHKLMKADVRERGVRSGLEGVLQVFHCFTGGVASGEAGELATCTTYISSPVAQGPNW